MREGRKGNKSTKSQKDTSSSQQPAGKARDEESPLQRGIKLKTYWGKLSEHQRSQFLSLSLTTLRSRANEHHVVAGRDVLISLLEGSIARLADRRMWMQWQWHATAPCFEDAASFRRYVRENKLSIINSRFLDTDSFRTAEARQALQKCMQKVQKQVAAHKRDMFEQEGKAPWRLQKKSAVICMIFKAIEKEHPYLFQAFAASVIYAIQQMLPTSHNCIVREPGEDDDYVLALADLERLQPSELTVITSWLEKQVAEMSRLAASPESLGEEYRVQPFCLSDHGSTLAVTAEWIKHLKEHEARFTDPANAGGVLEWLYCSNAAVSPREAVPGQSADRAFRLLVNTLKDVLQWEAKIPRGTDLLKTMERNKVVRDEMGRKADLRVRPFKADQSLQELPPEAVLCLLHEESEVMHVKRNHYSCLLHQAQQRMFAFNRQTSQFDAEICYLNAQRDAIDEKLTVSGFMHWCSSHGPAVNSALAAESARIERAMRKLAAEMQVVWDKQDATERDIQHQTKRHDALDAWGQEIHMLCTIFATHSAHILAAEQAMVAGSCHDNASKLQDAFQSFRLDLPHFQKVIWPKLTTPEQSQALYKAMQNQQVYVNKKFQEGCAVLPLMEAQVLHAACDNPGTVVVPHLILPLLRERLEVLADAALKGVTGAVDFRLTAAAGPSSEELEALYSKLLCTTPDSKSYLTNARLGLEAIHLLSEAQVDFLGRDLYGAYVDDLLFENILEACEKQADTSLSSTILRCLGPSGKMLAVSFFAHL